MLTLPRRSLGSDRRTFVVALLCAALFTVALPARASLTVLVGEPFDSLGKALPVGHATIYLDRICADGPLKLRMCQPGEPAGVAIARYNHIGQYDWLATPIMQFLYGTSRAGEIPSYATPELVEGLRQQYRREFLAELFPDGAEALRSNEEWWETAGMAYSRRFWGYQIATTREQDERFVAAINALPNRRAYRAYTANCANFAADLINLYFPRMVRRNRLADLGFTLPKQVARSVYLYGKTHPEADLTVIEIPQLPGSLPRSWRVRGGAETFLKTRRYLPILLAQPEIAATLAVLYLDHGRWKLGHPEEIATPKIIELQTQTLMANQ